MTFSNELAILYQILSEMYPNGIKLIEISQFVAIKAGIDAVLIEKSMLIRITSIVQFIVCVLQDINAISWIIDRYNLHSN